MSGLRAPFPWFGGKSRAAPLILKAIGEVENYVEPFAGSLATLLSVDRIAKLETVNDLDCHVANFWRSVSIDPEATAMAADWPINEADLHSRHAWLRDHARGEFRERMLTDPNYYDARIAGWWSWGICAWVGGNFCSEKYEKIPRPTPFLSQVGRGLLSLRMRNIAEEFEKIRNRLRYVRVCCGNWDRILKPAVTWQKNGLTGVLLDPPYSRDMRGDCYSTETDVSDEVRQWAIANGNNRLLRIVLCGYQGEHDMPGDWRLVEWKAARGFAKIDNKNHELERLWLSPHCVQYEQARLFA